jgi:hypothetical protein
MLEHIPYQTYQRRTPVTRPPQPHHYTESEGNLFDMELNQPTDLDS